MFTMIKDNLFVVTFSVMVITMSLFIIYTS